LLRVPFSVLLPLFALSVWVAVVAVPLTPLYLQLREEAKTAKDSTVNEGDFQYTVPREKYVAFHLNEQMKGREPWMSELDLPGMVGEIVTSLPTSWPQSWHPEGVELETWRLLTWTFYSLPFWWFAGVGVDAMLGRRRTHWAGLLLGTLLAVWFVVMTCGMAVVERAESSDGANVAWGAGLWAVLFLPMPVAWVLRWRRTRAERRAEKRAEAMPLSS
jgi:hypothetical protein